MYIAALNDFSDAQSNPCLAKSSFVSSSEAIYDSKVLKSKGLAPFLLNTLVIHRTGRLVSGIENILSS